MSEETKTCFIIQPLTTPEAYVEQYNGDKDHFIHVLNCLHIPAVERVGFKPMPPIAEGSDMIHAMIINKLETADLVLCDISCLNPNVFFEMGVRTALNKPICFVKDEHTGKIPFDTGILNHKSYKSTMHAWELENEINGISEHIRTSYERSENKNTLWRHLGMKAEAQPYERKVGTDGKLDEILFQLGALNHMIESSEKSHYETNDLNKKMRNQIFIEIEEVLTAILGESRVNAVARIESGDIIISLKYPELSTKETSSIEKMLLKRYGKYLGAGNSFLFGYAN